MDGTIKAIKKEEKAPTLETQASFYANGFGFTFSKNEMVINLMQSPPKSNGMVDTLRIYLLPESVKLLMKGCQSILKLYEKEHGKVEIEKNWKESTSEKD